MRLLILRVQGRIAEAVTMYEQAVQSWPDQVVVQYSLATALAQLGRMRDAQAAAQSAVQVDSCVPGKPFAKALNSLLGQLECAMAAQESMEGMHDFTQQGGKDASTAAPAAAGASMATSAAEGSGKQR